MRVRRASVTSASDGRYVSAVSDLVLAGAASLRSRLPETTVGFDTEGTGLIPYGPPGYWGYYPARPFAFSFCDTAGNQAWIRQRVDPRTRQVLPGRPGETDALRSFLGDPRYTKIGHNIAYDKRITEEAGYIWKGEIHDTMVMAHVVTAGDELSYALKPLSKKYLQFPDDDEKRLESAVTVARREAKAKGYLIAGGKKEVERGDYVVFAGSKPVKADYWLVPSPSATTTTPDDLVREYGVGDAVRAVLLFLFLWPILQSDRRLMATYRREMAGWYTLRDMERRGTRVYPRVTNYLINWYTDYMGRQVQIGDKNGGWLLNKKGVRTRMNYNSSKQLMQKFYVERGFPVEYKERKNKKTGEVKLTPTFGKDQLAMLGMVDEVTGRPQDELAKAILEYRSARQTISSFLNIYRKFWYPVGPIDPRDQNRFDKVTGIYYTKQHRLQRPAAPDLKWLYSHAVWILHPNYNQTGAVTGRMTCSDPNLQQVASATTGLRKSDIPQRPRECFGPRPGHVWYLPDYSQIEVWLFAFMSGDEEMKKLLLSGYDFHQGVADRSFVHRADYTPRKKYYRKLAKLIMFGKLYGGGVGTAEKPGRMTRLLQMPFHEAKEFIDSFEEQFAGVKRFMDAMVKDAKREKEAWNLYGRKYVMDVEWAYKVVNYLVQGTAADVLKMAMMRVAWMLETRWRHPTMGMLNSIHDEFMIEVPYDVHSLQLMREIAWVMQMDSDMLGIPVPLPVGMKMTKPQYLVRDRAWYQRWSDTAEVQIRPDSDIAYWKAKGIVEVKPDILGGVPRRKYEREEFADLDAHMRRCPYNTLFVTPTQYAEEENARVPA